MVCGFLVTGDFSYVIACTVILFGLRLGYSGCHAVC